MGGRHLPFVSYGHFQITIPVLSDFTVSAPLDRSAPLTFVTGRFYSNSCSADSLLFVILVLREEFAFLFQTFSRIDPPGQAPPTRGRSVSKKKNVAKFARFC